MLEKGDLVAEAVVLELHRVGQLLALLAAGLPVLLLANVGGRDQHAVLVLAALFDRLLYDLGGASRTVSLSLSVRPLS